MGVSRVFDGVRVGLLHVLLDRAAVKQRVVSENIANTTTPGYRRKDVEFKDVFEAARSPEPDSRFVTHPRHLPGVSVRRAAGGGRLVEDADSSHPSGGINNVDVDREMADLAATKGAYDIAAELLKRRFNELRTAINGRAGG
jgi:flagellar basal-body rod protein FlgB